MKQSMTFVATAAAIVVGGVLATRPFLAEGARQAVLAAGFLALGTQIPAYFLLKGWRTRSDRFLAAIGAGFAVRVAVVVLGVLLFLVPGRAEPAPFLLSLGAFLVAVLLAESCLEYRRLRADASPAAS